MICTHPMIISVIVKHWGGTWIEYRCCVCGTGIDMEKVKDEDV